ncbi:MAG: hypothetical protein IPK32_26375 [Verrucomicrobiaceae bacterium]|nr:hypothetical protein [Verrucomicrobiaceae bacterium]
MRDGRWGSAGEYDGTQPQLYDLAKDRGERTNLATQQPDTVLTHDAAALAWHRSSLRTMEPLSV